MTERETWERRHDERRPTAAPSAFVERNARRVAEQRPGARALDLACGAGRHAALLAGLGLETTALDFSLSALARAAPPGAPVHGVAGDATNLPFRDESFDLVVQTCFLDRTLFPVVARVLRPGGLLVAETFSVAQFEETGHPRKEFCLAPKELEHLCEQPNVRLQTVDSGCSSRAPDGSPRHLVAIAARRP